MANSMICIKNSGIISSKPSVLEQKIYCVENFSASTFLLLWYLSKHIFVGSQT